MLKICSKCKVEKDFKDFSKFNKNKDHLDSQCRLCHKIYNQENKLKRNKQASLYYQENKEEIELRKALYVFNNADKVSAWKKEYFSSLKFKFSRIKSTAKRRLIDFDLTIEEFSLFWQKPCTYCGSAIETIGLDRIDSSLSYSLSNCCSCCYICNIMKSTLTEQEWYFHMLKILKHKQII